MIIGFDLDDVLLGFFDALHPYCNIRYGTDCQRNDLVSFDLPKLWGISKEEAIKRVADFYQSPEHWDAKPIDGAIEKIKKLKQHHKLHVITAKPEELKNKTLEWLDKHFPQMFDGIHFTNHYHGSGLKRTKGEVCRELNIEFFVDDFLENVNDVANSGIPALLFDAPWNQGEIKSLVTRVYSWDEIAEILLT